MLHVACWTLACLGAAVALLASPVGAAEGPRPILRTLRTGHPRVLLTPDSLAALRKAVRDDAALKGLFAKLRRDADKLIKADTVEYKIVGPRLLSQSRRCLSRVETLGLAYLLSEEATYAERAVKELEAAAAFPDWNPSHFLDTAEMSCAFGIGYDWLYAYLDDARRKTLRTALVEKGLKPGLASYRGQERYGWWTRAHHNWSQVCNGGLAVGALAIADEAPDVCGEILESGLKAVQPAMANFGPDGSWNEGPGYWGYTLRYTSYYMAVLESALGSMQGLETTPGLDEAGTFRVYFVGPTNRTFNFADAGDGAGSHPSMFWLGRTFKRPLFAWHQRKRMGPSALDLLWYGAAGEGPKASGLPLHKVFRKDDVVFLRSAWEDPDALWAGFKGGDNRANHSHLDLGSFVLDALGVRWAVDLGGDDYNLPAYFGNKRWTYYRLRTESHNTLLINGENQSPRAKAPIVAFAADSGDGYTVADLSQAYPMARSVLRGVAMLGGKRVLVQDEVQADEPVDVLWGMVTRTTVAPDGRAVVLEKDGKRLYGRIAGPDGATFDTVSANPKPPQRQQRDASKLVVRLPGKVKTVCVAVVFSPDPKACADVGIKPLSQWPGRLR